ncbi:MAG TPA: GAF domain-containing protein [Candidatus Dormibacteraeota bacterium]
MGLASLMARGMDGGSGPVPNWLARALRPQAATSGSPQLALLGGITVLLTVILATDLMAPNRLGAGALVVLPVLAAGWALGPRGVATVVGVVALLEVAGIVIGQLSPLMVGGRMVTVVLVALVGRAAAVGFAEVRRARQREVGVLLRSSQLMGRSMDVNAVATEAVRVAAGTLVTADRRGIRRAALLRVIGDRAVVLAAHGDAVASTPPGPDRPIFLGQMPAALREMVGSGRPGVVLASDLTIELRDLSIEIGAAAWAVAPVRVAGDLYGVLAAASSEIDGFRRDDLRLLDGIARVTGLAMGAALRHAELEELEQRLQQSVELALEAGRTLEPFQVVDSILVRVTEGVAADQATLARVDGDHLVIESTYRTRTGERLVPLRRRFPPDLVYAVPELATALATGRPVVSGPLHAPAEASGLAAALPAGEHTLTVPLAVGGRTACLLALGRSDGRPFGEEDLAQLQPMVDVARLALRNAHLHAQTAKAQRAATTYSDRLEQAIEAAQEIGSGDELDEVVERVLRRAVAVVGADRGSISRLEDGVMIVEFDHDPTGIHRPPGTRWDLSESRLASEAIRTRQAVRGSLPDGPVAAEMAAWRKRAGLRHLIQCPLLVGRDVVGLLGLSRRRDEPFDDGDLETLQPFATLAALLLRNARLLDEARQVGQARSAFLHLAAHELRTPLTVIRGYLSMLEDGTYPVPERTRSEAVDTLVAKAQELESLVESLVLAARLEGGTVLRVPVRLDLGGAVREAAERARPRAHLEGATIEQRVPKGAAVVSADRDHVARILDNLLNNALTYSPHPAHVTLELRPGDPVEVAVHDRGHGIPADQQASVFERFHRVDGPAQRAGAGLGLGLSISRELAHLNDGALLLESSAPGCGSVFVLRLPS